MQYIDARMQKYNKKYEKSLIKVKKSRKRTFYMKEYPFSALIDCIFKR